MRQAARRTTSLTTRAAAPLRPSTPTTTMLTRRGPNPVDEHVGTRIRARRKLVGLSQQQLAESLELTFQQVQKYERGANRVSASKLWEIAKTLKAPIGYFFEGLGDPTVATGSHQADTVEARVSAFIATPDGMALANAFPYIRNNRMRHQIVELAKIAADENFVEEAPLEA